jgi:hypothetical protein
MLKIVIFWGKTAFLGENAKIRPISVKGQQNAL